MTKPQEKLQHAAGPVAIGSPVTPSSSSSSSSSSVSTAASIPIPLPTRLVLSALSGMGAATVCHPLDVIRVQLQTSSGSFRNSWHAATSIYNHHGLRNGLYAGLSAAYLRQWLYGSCRIGIYSYLLEHARMTSHPAADSVISFSHKLAMGAIAGGIGSFVGTPSEVALVRMAADSKLPLAHRRNYASVVDCLVRIAKHEGFWQLWRGATPTVARATLLSSVSMGVTSEAKTVLVHSGWFGKEGQWLGGYPMMMCATLASSLVATTVANPLDVVKSRIQTMPIAKDGTPLYTSMGDCLKKSVRAEGITVIWAGFTPAFLKMAPYSVISLTLADKLTHAFTGRDAL
jgi:solute carrier family 25 oxoglutarate transporter 11